MWRRSMVSHAGSSLSTAYADDATYFQTSMMPSSCTDHDLIVYVRIFRGTRHLGANTFYSIGTWAAISLVFWLIAWVLAESIPDFNDLLSLISSLFAAHFTLSLSGTFWLFMNWGHWFDGWKKSCLTVINFLIFLIVSRPLICLCLDGCSSGAGVQG